MDATRLGRWPPMPLSAVSTPEPTVKKVPVTTDIQDINYIQVKTGLKEGDMVVTGPYDIVSKQLKDKQKVKVVSKDELMKDTKH